MALLLKKLYKSSIWILYETNDFKGPRTILMGFWVPVELAETIVCYSFHYPDQKFPWAQLNPMTSFRDIAPQRCDFVPHEYPRAEDFSESSPLFIMGFLSMYWYTIKHIGPKFMENRKPFEIKNILLIYNIVQILVNISFIIMFPFMYNTIFNACVPIDYSRSEDALWILSGCRYFLWLKMFDCWETVFFVLRKSYRQVSFLHIYHHFGMVFTVWTGLRYYGGGHSVVIGAVNVIVHAVMFFYYLLTSIDSSWKKSLTFKRSLTQLQMVQFLYVIFSYGRVLLMSDCAYPKLPSYLLFTQAFFMFALFFDFYRKNYISKSKIEKIQKLGEKEGCD